MANPDITNQNLTNDSQSYTLPTKSVALQPIGDGNAAADLIRTKLASLYANEPDATDEQTEVEAISDRSVHQQFMHQLTSSGKSLAEIQTQWHAYYLGLPDDQKHIVWREFYSNHDKVDRPTFNQPPEPASVLPPQPVPFKNVMVPKPDDTRTVADIKNDLLSRVQHSGRKPSRSQNIKSLIFGASVGCIVVVFLLFGFFNERFIAPFITPSRSVSATPIVIDPSSLTAGPDPLLIIPKINVEIPVVYDVTTIEESTVQEGLERGVVKYANTSNPGEKGNGVIFGHSSNNILNKGKYKFAFVLLSKLDNGDTFIIQKDSKQYVYRVFSKRIVPPTEVSVLNPVTDKAATFTLITCDPPGTSLNRLVVLAEQISPDPNSNVTSTATGQPASQLPSTETAELPSNSPSLWSRFTSRF